MAKRCALLLVGVLWASVAFGQATTGTPPFGAYQTVGFGNLNLQNLNVNFTIPVFTKAGRGLNFSFPIAYNSLIYYPYGGAWVVVTDKSGSPTWGWQTNYPAGAAWGYTQSNIACKRNNQRYFGTWDHLFWYKDATGTTHKFGVSIYNGGIDTECGYTDYYESEAYDNSGYLFNFNAPNGPAVFDVHGNDVSNVASTIDTNGNYVSEVTNGSTSTYTDTLGDTAFTVTVVSSTETDYSYTNPSGGTSTIKLLSTSFPIKTVFACTGVSEYRGTATLPTELLFPDGSNYKFTYEGTPGYSGYYTGRIASVTLPTGGQITYQYTGGNNGTGIECSDGSTAGLKVGTPDGTWIYSRSGSAPAWSTTVTDPQQNQTAFNFQGIYPTEEQDYQGSSTLLRTAFTCYNGATPNCNSTAITTPITQRAVYTKWPGGQESEINNSYLANTALPIEEDDYGYGSGSRGGLIRKIFTTYANLGNNIYGDPASVTVQNSSGGTVAQTTYTYDQGTPTTTSAPQHTSVSGSRGNLTTVAYLVSGSTTLSKTMTYFDTGMVETSTDLNANQTTYTYGACGDSFPTQVSGPLSLSRSMTWNCSGGVETSVTDENGQVTSTAYNDPNYWRPTKMTPPVGWNLITYPSTTETDSYLGITDTTASTSCSSCRHDETVLDGLGRNIDSYLVNDPDGETTVATTYDSDGRVSESTYPYRGTVNGEDSYGYDGLNRVVSITHADGTSSSVAYGSAVTGAGVNTTQLCSSSTYGLGYPSLATDEAGNRREVWTDGLGRTIEVDEPNSSGGLTENTCYAYDPNNNLVKVVSPAGQTRTYAYDDLSRVLSVSVPETNVGGTQYSTTYSYTSSGSPCSGDPTAVCSRTDPRGITTTYAYDALNRLTKISYSDSTPTVTYCYDGNNTSCISGGYSSTNGKARRTAMSDGSGDTGWSYDADGRIVTEKRTIAGVTKTISYSYNEDGSMASITYPSGHVVTYTTGDAERPLSAVDSGSSINYAMTASYSPAGAVSAVVYGRVTGGFNGITESDSYNNRLEPTAISDSSSNGTALSLTYCFGAFTFANGCSSSSAGNNGSVTGITNSVDSNETQSLTYDTLNRIASAATKATTGNDCWGQNFGPDTVANLTSISVSQCSAGSLSVTTDGYNHLSASGYGYDDAGDMTGDGAHAYFYDAEQRIIQVDGTLGNCSTATACYVYDGDGFRAEKSTGTLYWRGITGDVLAESDLQGNITNEYVFFAGQRIAQRTPTGSVYFYYADSVGTIHTITDGTGHACYDATFTPYGQEMLNPNISQTCSSDYKFAGYRYDSETGLYYAKARYYNPRLGRFMSTDPLGGDSTSPQSLNGYAYAVNDPEDMIPIGTFTPSMTASSLNGPAASSLSPVPEPSTMNLQMRVQAARAELQELISDYLQRSNGAPSAPQELMGCKIDPETCPPAPPKSASVKWGPYSYGIPPTTVTWTFDNIYTFYDYARIGQLQSGAGFFSPSWDQMEGQAFESWVSSPSTVVEEQWQIQLQEDTNPDQMLNDSPSLWVDPGFPTMDWGLLFGAGGGAPPGQQCGIGGIDPACSL